MKYIALVTAISVPSGTRGTVRNIIADSREELESELEKYKLSLSALKMEVLLGTCDEPTIYNKQWVPETTPPVLPETPKAATLEV